MKNKCVGVGKLFGHKFKPVYETDKEYYSANEKVAIIQHEIYRNPLGNLTGSNYIDPATQPKRITSILKGLVCSRCGIFIKNNPIEF